MSSCCSGGGKYNLAKLFHHELIGDVPKKHIKNFVTHLLAGKTSNTPGLARWHERIKDEARFDEAFRLCEYCTGILRFTLYSQLIHALADGGFVNDWICLFDAQLEDESGRNYEQLL